MKEYKEREYRVKTIPGNVPRYQAQVKILFIWVNIGETYSSIGKAIQEKLKHKHKRLQRYRIREREAERLANKFYNH